MELRDQIESLYKEQEDLLHLLKRVERALQLASKEDFSEHSRSISELHALEYRLADITEHCHAAGRLFESTCSHFLEKEEYTRIDSQHEEIIRAVTDFREELKGVTAERITAMIVSGTGLVDGLRTHFAFERGLFDRIARMAGVGTPAPLK